MTLTPVDPVLPVAPWLGGKRNLAKRITAILDAVPHATYAEPFVGMGGRSRSRPWRWSSRCCRTRCWGPWVRGAM